MLCSLLFQAECLVDVRNKHYTD